ncbi:MAG: MotA/TolQ/ExbB proton channel family protein [Phycisphaerales bacterium]|nr:MotA/TolQ/ExbB proton channel family protein [Phycisphaerales bacterium]
MTLSVLMLSTTVGPSRSFAATFFLSRNADGGIEIIGTSVTWLLLCLSAVALGLVLAMLMDTRRSDLIPESLFGALREDFKSGNFKDAIRRVKEDRSFLARILRDSFSQAPSGHAAMRRALEQAADAALTGRSRRLEVLNVLGQVSPMIGLFGTVYGMILAFHAIVISGGAADAVELAGGIGTALTTTFWGLVVAIPSMAAYAILRQRLDGHATEALLGAEQLLGRLQRGARSSDS